MTGKLLKGFFIVVLLGVLSLLGVIAQGENSEIYTFPSMHIEMEQPLHRHIWQSAVVSVTSENFRHEFSTADVQIRGRGQSTWRAGVKRPFRIRFDTPREMIGAGHVAHDWTFISYHADRSLMRGYSARYLANLLDGMYMSPFGRFVNIYINGEYQGVYLMSIQVSEATVGRAELTRHQNPTISEYMIEMNGHAMPRANDLDEVIVIRGRAYEIRFPSRSRLTCGHIQYVEDYLDRVYDLIFDHDDEVFRYIHLPSFVDFYIVQELFKNLDIGFNSVFMQIRGHGAHRRLEMGPVWDFDGSSGNSIFNAEFIPYGHHPYGLWAGISNRWYRNLLQMPTFRDALVYRWNEVKDAEIRQMIDHIDYKTHRYEYAFLRNFDVWCIYGSDRGTAPPEFAYVTTFRGHVDYLIDYFERRVVWLDEYFNR